MIKHFLSKMLGSEQLFDNLPSGLINHEGILLTSNEIFKKYISTETNVSFKDILMIRTIDNQIIGTINGVSWILIYKYYSNKECRVWAVPEMPGEPLIWSELPMPMLLTDPTGRIINANPAFLKMFPDYMPQDEAIKFCLAFDEKFLVNGNVQEVIWRDTLCKMRTYEHAQTLWLIMLENITDIGVVDSKWKEVHYLKAMGQITSSVVHDFRNILSVINGYCELIIEGCDIITSQNYIKQISNTVSNASNMVNELLKFSRTSNALEVSCDPYEVLNKMKQVAEKMIGPLIKITIELRETAAMVGLSEMDLERIMTNIIINARDAIAGEGTIKITLAKKYFDKGWTINSCHIRSGFYILISVDDSGHGIAAAEHQKVFNPFFTTKRNGNGLGLSTILSILRDMSGCIHMISNKGCGTRVNIYLPIIQSLGNSTPKIALQKLKTNSRISAEKQIVMVEDNPDVLSICSMALLKEGYKLRQYQNAEEALDSVKPEDQVDLLITDVNLPGMSGAEMVHIFRSRQKNIKNLLVISGYDTNVLENKFPLNTNFLSKPIPITELKNRVHKILISDHEIGSTEIDDNF